MVHRCAGLLQALHQETRELLVCADRWREVALEGTPDAVEASLHSVRGAHGRRPIARLGEVAGIRRRLTARRAGAHTDIGRAGVARARAVFGDVADSRARATERGGKREAVSRAGGTCPGAALGHVTDADARSADGGGGSERVRRTRGRRARATLRHVAGGGGSTTHRRGRKERIPGARGGGPVADLPGRARPGPGAALQPPAARAGHPPAAPLAPARATGPP